MRRLRGGNVRAGRDIGMLTAGDQGNAKGIRFLLQDRVAVTSKLKLGLNGGLSRNRDRLASTADFKSGSNVSAGVYCALTKRVTLSLNSARPVRGTFSAIPPA